MHLRFAGESAIEHQLTDNMSLSAAYIFVGPITCRIRTDLNTPNTALQIQNFVRCFGTNPTSTQAVATVNPATCNAPRRADRRDNRNNLGQQSQPGKG